MIITDSLLKANKACSDQRGLFKATFPAGMPVTLANIEAARAAGLDIGWAICLLPASARAEYRKALAPAWAEYDKALAPAQAEYRKAIASAWAGYYKATALVRAEYDKALDSAWAEYDKALASALYAAAVSAGMAEEEVPG